MKSSKDFLSGTLRTIILALLKEHGKMYGYEICQLTAKLTHEEILLTEGAIYPALHKMEKQGLLVSSKVKVNGRTRKYYELNQESLSEVAQEIRLLLDFSKHLKNLLKPAL